MGPDHHPGSCDPRAKHLRADGARQLACATVEHRQSSVGIPHVQGRRIVHLPRSAGEHAARVRRFVHVRAAAIPASFIGISSLDAFALGLPALYVQGFGNSAGPFAYQEWSAFGQDDWRLEPRLTVKAGCGAGTDLAGRRHDGHRARRHSTALRVSAGSEQSGAAARGLCRFGWHWSDLFRRRVWPVLRRSACRHPGLADCV